MIPWLTRLPTPAEVAAHAKSRPANVRRLKDGSSFFGLWLAAGDKQDGCVYAIGAHRGKLLSECGVLPADARWLPCTAEGIPVCLLPKEPTPTIGDLLREGIRGRLGT